MIGQLLEYVKNNPQEVMFQAVLSVTVIIFVALAITIWVNRYRYRKYYGLARKHFQLGEPDQSIQALKIARRLAKKPISGKKRDLERTSSLLAEVAISASEWDEAIQALTECIDIGPKKTEYHVSLVESYLRAQKVDQARESLDKALQLVPTAKVDELKREKTYPIARSRKDEEIEKELGKLQGTAAVSRSEKLDKLEILQPDFEGRRFILEGIIQAEQDNIDLAGFYIRQYILERNLPEADQKTDERQADPSEREIGGLDIEEREEIEVREETPEEVEEAIRTEAARAEEIQTGETQAAQIQAKEIGAEEIEKEIRQARPETEEQPAEEEHAQEYTEKEDEEDRMSHLLVKARKALDLLETEPRLPEFYTLSAFLSVEEGEPEVAGKSYESAIEIDPQHAQAYYDLALLCVDEFDDPQRAIENLRSAVQCNPEFAEAHHNLALLLLGSEETFAEVKHHLEEATKSNPVFSEVYHDLALLLARRDFKEFLLG
uniref:Tetratricopeptide repeat-containing protein n=1 Tax=Candidatus Kentrum sp. FM TaxID=2126340 RepID=A0A450VV39_9GAMM|nr:MAG: Tetratricopeptide repeat-containing protein [Candidatus Kentron sp. FM]VFJ50113.1 MAG: Tetratricopeptide repeat-containing protein [Candidatus Kentron sp. FM]VFK08659.1 MAG: Tetratricopeptide repeat-containing protein [Candidatus Kentron sp. FM]